MKPNFALSLSFQGLSLLHRVDGGWKLIGEVDLDDPHLTARLEEMRETALALAPDGITTKLIIPNEQIKYHRAPLFGATETERMAEVRLRLVGVTPYVVEDLVYDWRMSGQGSVAQIAAVARETLDEAETFAWQHQLNPVSFVAEPPEDAFEGEPFFGTAQRAGDILDEGDRVEPDVEAIVRVETPPEPEQEVPDVELEVAAPEDIGFVTSRQGKDVPRVTPPIDKATDDPAPRLTLVVDPPMPDAAPAVDDLPAEAEPKPKKPNGKTQKKGATGSKDKVAKDVAAQPVTAAVSTLAEKPLQLTNMIAPASTPGDASNAPGLIGRALKTDPETERKRLAREKEAEQLTVFGARKKPAGDPGQANVQARHKAVLLTAALLLLVLVTAMSLGGPREAMQRWLTGPVDVADTQAPLPVDPNVLPSPEELAEAADPEVSTAEPEIDPAPAVVPIAVPTRLTPDEAGQRYEATGIWQRAPDAPGPPAPMTLEALDIPSISTVVLLPDAVALPSPRRIAPDQGIQVPGALPDAGNSAQVGDAAPPSEEAVPSDEVVVTTGPPPVLPPVRAEDGTASEELAQTQPIRPLLRPEGLAEQFRDAAEEDDSAVGLAAVRPRERPEGLTAQVAEASGTALGSTVPLERLQNDQINAAVAQALTAGTAQAVRQSLTPRLRPDNIAEIAQQSRSEPSQQVQVAAAVAPRVAQPSGPTGGTVSRNATIDNALNLRRVNLIGIYGKPSSREALVRLPNGRYVNVGVGDRVDGGRVTAIGDGELRYVKRGRNVILTMPGR